MPSFYSNQYEPRCKKTRCMPMPKQRHRSACTMVSTYVVLCFDSVIPLVSTSKAFSLLLATVADTGMCLTWRQICSRRGSYDLLVAVATD